MAYLYRVGAFVLLVCTLCMLLSPKAAHASFPATQTNTFECTVGPCYQYKWISTWRNSLAAACADAIGGSFAGDTITSASPVAPSGCAFSGNGGQITSYYGLSTQSTSPADPTYSCPGGATLSGSTCTCSAGYSQDGNTCVSQQATDNATCKALADGLNYLKDPLIHYGSIGLTACFGGFVLSGTGAASGGGQTELYGPFKCSGASASSCSVVPKPSDIVTQCPPGSYPGMVNGVQVCVPPQSTVDTPKTTTATPPTPGASAPEIPNAPAGTTSQSEQTTCTGTTCTKTITYRDGSGNSTGTKTEEQSRPNYCSENPKAPGCTEEKSTFGGNCAGGFTFTGDAIEGAIAQEVYRQNCLMNQPTDEATLYSSEKAKTGDQTGSLPGNHTVSLSPADFDTTDAIGGAACIADRTVTVWGKTLVIAFSSVCPVMGYLKNILLAVSFLTAAGIVIGRKT